MVVVEFENPFNLKPGLIEPACLPTKKVEIGTKCYVSGWGVINATERIPPHFAEGGNSPTVYVYY